MPSGFKPLTSASVEAFVLANAGARPADRDAVDTRIVQEVRSRTGRFVKTQTDVGGWPTLAVNARALTLPQNPHAVTASGYTNLEIWLHGHASAIGAEPQHSGLSTPTGQQIRY
jgi:hypothetical protein